MTPPDLPVFAPGAGRIPDPPGTALNAAARRHPEADLVVVAGPATPAAGWLPVLRAAAHSDDTLAAATVGADGPGDAGLGEPPIARGDGAGYPRVLWPWPHLTWIRRSALSLVGPFDEELSHPGAVLADFGARTAAHGLTTAVVGELTLPRTAAAPAPCPPPELERLRRAHPWLPAAAAAQVALEPGPLRRAVLAGRSTHATISVTVDARSLGEGVGGTQAYVLALVLALAARSELTVRALVAPVAPEPALAAFRAAGVQIVGFDRALRGVERSDVVHRPQQVFSADDLRVLQAVGDRLVITQMDLILYRNPAYHATAQGWQEHRRATRLALALADGVVFFSGHARAEALAEELIEPERTFIAGVGIERPAPGDEAERPPGVPVERRLLLMLGSDYAHKNRPFAMALVDALRRRHGWDGLLVLAGPHQPRGSSAAAERELLSGVPELAGTVIDLGPVSEAQKRWLMTAAEAHICASNYEGFGLAPLEAGAAGRPCIYAPCTSLGEIIDPGAASIVPWDPAASADAAAPLLTDGEARARHLSLLDAAVDRHTWEDVAARLVHCYRRTLDTPYRGAGPLAWGVENMRARRELEERIAYGRILIDDHDGLLTHPQQRGLMRVATRRWLRGPLLGPFSLLGLDQRERTGRPRPQ